MIEPPFPTTAGLADPRRGSVGEIREVALPLADGLGIDAQDRGDVLDPSVAEFGRFEGGVTSAIVLAQGVVEGSHGPLDVGRIRCHEMPRQRSPGAERSLRSNTSRVEPARARASGGGIWSGFSAGWVSSDLEMTLLFLSPPESHDKPIWHPDVGKLFQSASRPRTGRE